MLRQLVFGLSLVICALVPVKAMDLQNSPEILNKMKHHIENIFAVATKAVTHKQFYCGSPLLNTKDPRLQACRDKRLIQKNNKEYLRQIVEAISAHKITKDNLSFIAAYTFDQYFKFKSDRSNRNIVCSQDTIVVDIVKALLVEGLSINTVDEHGRTMLYYACMTNNIELAKFLIRQPGINVNIQTKKEFYSPLHVVCFIGNSEIFEIVLSCLCDKVDVNIKDKYNATPMHYLVGRPDQNARTLFGTPELYSNKQSAVDYLRNYESISQCRLIMLKRLIKEGALVSNKDEDGYTPLSYVNEYGHEEFIQLLQDCINDEYCEKESKKNHMSEREPSDNQLVIQEDNMVDEEFNEEFNNVSINQLHGSLDQLDTVHLRFELLSFKQN